ncbi:hypothetical protein J3R30DRAFT_3405915 [Lentinula aciculospora]|uniref:DNA (cytosine-5-)-methyltransferase n=1 Tax=Lentinula aciculospora TaxID=153920 RepID=A0A9W9A6I3_9AGAR|nr:hypothetical protein J3R30DRAFT_3405915 [Lentinula aciculospora]
MPMNYFQQRIREGMNDVVEEHVTPMFSSIVVERTTNVPFKPGASLKAIKNSALLHPSQKRIVTAREVSRCQGFPDWYTFLKAANLKEDVRRAYKQIGNAVPVPLAFALGQSLFDALITTRDRFGRAGSPDI